MDRDEFSEKGDGQVPDDDRNPDDIDPSVEDKRRIDPVKEARVRDACQRRDVEELQALAQSSGGFLTDELRQQACKRNVMQRLWSARSSRLTSFHVTRADTPGSAAEHRHHPKLRPRQILEELTGSSRRRTSRARRGQGFRLLSQWYACRSRHISLSPTALCIANHILQTNPSVSSPSKRRPSRTLSSLSSADIPSCTISKATTT